MAKTPKITKFVKNGPIFHKKSLTMGILSYQNDPWRWRGFEAQVAHACPNQIWMPPVIQHVCDLKSRALMCYLWCCLPKYQLHMMTLHPSLPHPLSLPKPVVHFHKNSNTKPLDFKSIAFHNPPSMFVILYTMQKSHILMCYIHDDAYRIGLLIY